MKWYFFLPKRKIEKDHLFKMDIKGGWRKGISWKSDGEMHICRLLTPKKVHSRQKTNETCLNVHLVGVRRMSLLTGLLLFFSRSFTSLHDRTFEKTMFDEAESLTGSNNITLNTLARIFRVSFTQIVLQLILISYFLLLIVLLLIIIQHFLH